jgi:hypothetical protein
MLTSQTPSLPLEVNLNRELEEKIIDNNSDAEMQANERLDTAQTDHKLLED